MILPGGAAIDIIDEELEEEILTQAELVAN